ncbi:MAG TPA: helix-turn-helix domain-containing protein [Verrucomicrobiae bacterium]|nr:helix-turn-helix domain-containing protein [Verrucomicrobiae bacterium]
MTRSRVSRFEEPEGSCSMPRFDLHNPEVWEQLAPECHYRALELAALAGISGTQLKRCSHELFQAAPQDLLIGWRREDSLGIVAEEPSLKEASDALGYKQRSHFSRDFKGFSGVAPKGFRSLPEHDREYLKMTLQTAASLRRCRILLQILARKNENVSARYKMVVRGTKMVVPGTSGQLRSGCSQEHHRGRQ